MPLLVLDHDITRLRLYPITGRLIDVIRLLLIHRTMVVDNLDPSLLLVSDSKEA